MTKEPSTSPFLDTVREAIRVRHYSIRTRDAYVHWIKRYILFHGKRHRYVAADLGRRSCLVRPLRQGQAGQSQGACRRSGVRL